MVTINEVRLAQCWEVVYHRPCPMSRMLPKAAAPKGGEVEKGGSSFRFCGCLVQI